MYVVWVKKLRQYSMVSHVLKIACTQVSVVMWQVQAAFHANLFCVYSYTDVYSTFEPVPQ